MFGSAQMGPNVEGPQLMSNTEDNSAWPVWFGKVRTLFILLFAWSLPASMFGMQAGVIAGSVSLLALMVWTGRTSHMRTPLDHAILFLLFVIGLSLVLAPKGVTSFKTATSFWVMSAFYVTWSLLGSRKQLVWAVSGIIAIAGLAAVLGIVQSQTGQYPLFELFHPDANPTLRLVPVSERPSGVGFFFSRLTFAHVLLFPFCWALALCFEPFGVKRRMLFGAAAVLIAAGIFTTWTRAAPVAAGLVGLGLLIGWLRRGKGRRLVTLAVVLAFVGGAVALAPSAFSRLQKSFAGRADWTRLAIWHTAFDMASDNPVSGVGYGNFQRDAVVYIDQRVASVKAKKFPGVIAWAHNNLLSFLAEMGFIGVWAFCFLFLVYFRSAGGVLKKLDQNQIFLRGFVRGAIGSVCAFLAVGMFHDTFFDGEVIFTLWFTMAASLAVLKLAKHEASP
jgi:O-antigen ligase/polysaccharide polymerase Wzy-like membrane protein